MLRLGPNKTPGRCICHAVTTLQGGTPISPADSYGLVSFEPFSGDDPTCAHRKSQHVKSVMNYSEHSKHNGPDGWQISRGSGTRPPISQTDVQYHGCFRAGKPMVDGRDRRTDSSGRGTHYRSDHSQILRHFKFAKGGLGSPGRHQPGGPAYFMQFSGARRTPPHPSPPWSTSPYLNVAQDLSCRSAGFSRF